MPNYAIEKNWQCPECERWFAAPVLYEPITNLCFDCWQRERFHQENSGPSDNYEG